ncbi:PREDICTED: FK506-binding protein 3-like [Polistes dominula]|uniref:FK506-binding protein 3-like n=1 Tax=Polistes dominula TaxID=743375 RepID=A0ABM1JGZ6_POLDO|nr:PREDICTED: FK506-binding protein 3-like [Polistes dominula]
MRDTSDMTEDALSEDTMMDCGGDGGGALEDFVELATNIADSSRTIRDAAERLLTLLGVDDENEDLLSSSEDEGVEVDVEDEEDDDRPENTRLLHQLAASLAQELKYSQQKHDPGPTRILTQGRGVPFDDRDQTMEIVQDTSYLGPNRFRNQIDLKTLDSQFNGDPFNNAQEQFVPTRRYSLGYSFQGHSNELNVFESKESLKRSNRHHYRHHHHHHHHHHHRRSKINEDEEEEDEEEDDDDDDDDDDEEEEEEKKKKERSMILHRDYVPESWGSGWDACATEALRYLVEDEGLPAHHPTVLAMKNHLEIQRGRVFAQYTA